MLKKIISKIFTFLRRNYKICSERTFIDLIISNAKKRDSNPLPFVVKVEQEVERECGRKVTQEVKIKLYWDFTSTPYLTRWNRKLVENYIKESYKIWKSE